MSATKSLIACSCTSVIITVAPSRANTRAVVSPMPLAAPVIMATLLVNRFIFNLLN
ncbi:hypothetical protein [Moraxella lacunata]|uniref:hypothetical protein n=1 Tax=Moraxella lacunata TaxID=477 RepID=UPI003EE1C873